MKVEIKEQLAVFLHGSMINQAGFQITLIAETDLDRVCLSKFQTCKVTNAESWTDDSATMLLKVSEKLPEFRELY